MYTYINIPKEIKKEHKIKTTIIKKTTKQKKKKKKKTTKTLPNETGKGNKTENINSNKESKQITNEN